jgi:penicillin-insensitive murein endopeptidase
MRRLMFAIALIVVTPVTVGSTCYGTVARGRLDGGVSLPEAGANFTAYSALGVRLGRTYVHSAVRDVVVVAYGALVQSAPAKSFVYGETGFAQGGQIRPHKTHQAGLSVDFMVPVLGQAGASVPLPTTVANKFGYGIEFDRTGGFGNLRIDFVAMAEHLYQLSRAADRHQLGIDRVIFDQALMPLLFATPRGPWLQQHLHFMKERPWIRHDEHYHVDFATACRRLR